MKLAKYIGIADTRKVKHDRLGDAELVFLSDNPLEVSDEQATALKELCPGEFTFSAVKDDSSADESQGELALDSIGDDSLQNDPEGAQIDPSAEGNAPEGESKGKRKPKP